MTEPDTSTARPVAAAEFTAAMAAFAPFETPPALAVAVSGGRDSLALTLLAADWVRERGGRVLALTVDHRLRPAAAVEARRVGAWLSVRGIEHRVLVWRGPYPEAGVQAAARDARYRLLADCCAAEGILHLLLGHHAGDQSETRHMRRARQSSGPGLAGISAIRELPQARILRPLLALPRERLTETLTARGQDWIDDPTNIDAAYERSRVRTLLRDDPGLRDGPGLTVVSASADAIAADRVAADAAQAAAAAACIAVLPTGYLRLCVARFAALPEPVRRQLLARCVMTAGGRIYPPRGLRLTRLAEIIAGGRVGRGRTLGGCRIVPQAGTGGATLLVVREMASIADDIAIVPASACLWDGRFAVRADDRGGKELRVGALGLDGWRDVARRLPEAEIARLPAPVRPTLPAIRRDGRVVAVSHWRVGDGAGIDIGFAPIRPLTDAGFAFISGPGR